MTLRCSGPKPAPVPRVYPPPCATMAPEAPGKPAGAMPSGIGSPQERFHGQADPNATPDLQRASEARQPTGAARNHPLSIRACICLSHCMRAYGRRPFGRDAKSTISSLRGLRWRSGSEDGRVENTVLGRLPPRCRGQCQAIRLRLGWSLSKGFPNSEGSRSSRKKRSCARKPIPLPPSRFSGTMASAAICHVTAT
jgi:hypothetical protein